MKAPLLVMLLLAAASSAAAKSPARERAGPAPRLWPAAQGTLAIANRLAVHEPSASRFINAAQVYEWTEGALYRLYAAPGLVSDIALQPGEILNSVAAGDTARWVIGDTTSGSGVSKRTHVLVKPVTAGLRTNLVITTDRRVYLLLLQSTTGTSMPAISWTYPLDALLAIRAAREEAFNAGPVASGIAVDGLNFNYRIEGARVAWRPVRVFDDGTQVFVEFPSSLGATELPPFFVIGASGKAELVNYRLRGRYYVIDRLFAAAELRTGEKRQSVVRIVRSDGRPGNGR